eukprot:SAG31_NODE_416_length_15934_cov_7.384970_3_plen_128_part_00
MGEGGRGRARAVGGGGKAPACLAMPPSAATWAGYRISASDYGNPHAGDRPGPLRSSALPLNWRPERCTARCYMHAAIPPMRYGAIRSYPAFISRFDPEAVMRGPWSVHRGAWTDAKFKFKFNNLQPA